MGLFPMLDTSDEVELDRSEFIRFLAESPWYPTFFASDNNLRWNTLSDTSAVVHYDDGSFVVDLTFTFGEDDLIKSIRCNDRGRSVGDEIIPTTWVGNWSNYQNQSGFTIPMEGEVAWIIDDSSLTYWKGEVTKIKFGY